MKAIDRSLNLYIRNRIYYFRRVYPKSVQSVLGRNELCMSLKTSDRAEAVRRAREQGVRFDREVSELHAERTSRDARLVVAQELSAATLTPEKAYQLARYAKQSVFDDFYERYVHLHKPTSNHTQMLAIQQLQRKIESVELHSARNDNSILADSVEATLLRLGQTDAVDDPQLVAKLAEPMYQAQLESLRERLSRTRGRAYAHRAIPGFEECDYQKDETRERTSKTLKSIADEYVRHKQPSWSLKTRAKLEAQFQLCLDHFSAGKPIAEITREDCKEFRDEVLAHIPANHRKRTEYRDLSPLQISRHAKQRKLAPMHYKTKLQYFAALNTLLRYAEQEGYIDRDPSHGLSITRPKALSKQKPRHPFTHDEILALFKSPLFTGSRSKSRRTTPGKYVFKDGFYWMPLIAAYSGMRLGEILMLDSADVRQDDNGIWYFDVREDLSVGRELKTASSIRRVPVNKVLIQLGLIEHSAALHQTGKLFPDLHRAKTKRPGDAYSKSFSRQLGLVRQK